MPATIGYASASPLLDAHRQILRSALDEVYADVVTFKAGADLGFGVDARVRTLSPKQFTEYPFPKNYLVSALHMMRGQWPDIPSRTLFLDIETWGVEHRWNLDKRKFFRLGQWGWHWDGDIHTTTDYDELMAQVEHAELIIAHNGHGFDFSALYGTESMVPLDRTEARMMFDTMVHANLVFPAPYQYTNRKGVTYRDAAKPERAKKWLSLDNLNFQLNLSGKEGDLQTLAKKYNPAGTKVMDLQYHLIPTDDPDFLAYAVGDITSLRELARAELLVRPLNEYDWREQLNAAIDAQNTRNGFTVDIAVASARVQYLTGRKEKILTEMQEKYAFPTEGAMPWRTTVGKGAIFKALADQGITPQTRPDWQRTKTGNLSLGGEVLIELTQGTDAEDMGQAMAEVMGQRSLAQLALDSVQNDGKVHPEITSLQRSGRKSTTKPGLTVWGSREGRDIDKEYFIASPGCSIVTFDYSQADARIVAAYSGDLEFAKRFEEGVDAHELTGRLVFGDYDDDPVKRRQEAKQLGHAYAYRAGAKKLAATSKQPLDVAETFVRGMQRAYPLVTMWQDEAANEGASGMVVNDWGREMVVDPDRSYTQAPALYGQSGTRELMVDALIRMYRHDKRIITWLVGQIHDELVFDVPNNEMDTFIEKGRELMAVSWQPADGSGQLIEFPVSVGTPASNWRLACH